jgi:uroporphyrin-III C-methyltransferase/precorrin-2 dehydrogenase/sirohydrochlorin ferrochelatase
MPPSLPQADALPHLPVFLTVRGRVCVLVGGGDATPPKLELLRRAGAAIRLVGADPSFAETAAGAEILPGPLTAGHLAGACLVIDASGDDRTNQHSAALARAAGVPLNVVDRPALCDFILPAILDRSPVVVAISTGGAAPALAGLIRQELEVLIPPGLGRFAALSGTLREEIRRRIADPARRLAFWRRLYRDGAADRATALDLLDQVATARRSAGSLTRIVLGPGSEPRPPPCARSWAGACRSSSFSPPLFHRKPRCWRRSSRLAVLPPRSGRTRRRRSCRMAPPRPLA